MDYMSELIAFQNDVFRNKMSRYIDVSHNKIVPGLRTSCFGINKLSIDTQLLIYNLIGRFDDFNDIHDTRGWHEKGVITFPKTNFNIIWTIDYYDENYRTLIDNPVKENKPVRRVLTTVFDPLL